MSFVYFIGCQNRSGELRVKIGFTRRHPEARLMDFQPGSPEELDVLAYIPGNLMLERALHENFKEQRLHNEWFLAEGPLGTLVSRLMHNGSGARAPTSIKVFWDALDGVKALAE